MKATRNNTPRLLALLLGLLAIGGTLTACSSDSDDEPQGTEQTTSGRRLRQLTIADVPITRATLGENGNDIDAKWTQGDAATYINLSQLETQELMHGNLTALKSGTTTPLQGQVVCMQADRLAVIYPAVDAFDSDGSYTISLSGQKGTLADVAQRYHYIYGVAEVTETTEQTATATIEPMQPLLALCKFTFKDASGSPIPVKRLEIGYGTTADVGYPQTATVTLSEDFTSYAIDDAVFSGLLAVELGEETAGGVYVALLPCGEDEKVSFFFSATTAAGTTYSGTAKAALKAGKYYPVSLKLNN